MSQIKSRNELIETLISLKYFIKQSKKEYDDSLKKVERDFLYKEMGNMKFKREKHLTILNETIDRLKKVKMVE